MRLNHNLASLNVYRAYSNALQKESAASAKISSGLKINSAKDDPSGLVQSEKMRIQIRGLEMAAQNAQDGVSMLQTAESGMNEMTSMAQRIRQLVVQSGGATTPEDKADIQKEIDETLNGMDTIAKNTEFNGVKLLDGDKNLEMPIGANSGESAIIQQKNLETSNLKTSDGKSLSQLKSGGTYSITNTDNIDDALNIVDQSVNTILNIRSHYGALENRFQETYNNLNEISDKTEEADSSLRDTDIAEEMAEYTKSSILSQAGDAMMVQANKLPQDVLQILQNVKNK